MGIGQSSESTMAENKQSVEGDYEPATVGAGCFWGVEKYFVNEVIIFYFDPNGK
jgi:hypothetical protein